ncbi:MAG: hemerythrin domain-containing protein [Myxococcales bacterium]|nr:hemerythrin domain-containing protein [Myxococcales bacterium]
MRQPSSEFSEYLTEHQHIEQLAEEVVATVRAGDWSQCGRAWARFVELLESHLTTEEYEVFPQCNNSALVDRLISDHELFRRRLEQTMRAIHEKAATEDEILSLVILIREHGELEDELLYPTMP